MDKKNKKSQTERAGEKSYEEILEIVRIIQKKVETISKPATSDERLLQSR